MIGPPPFPTSPDELTADLVASALNAPVTSLQMRTLGADRGMLGQIALVTPLLADGTPLDPIVAKFAAHRAGGRASSRRASTHLRELNFYDRLATQTPVSVPKCFGAWHDDDTDEFLLLQSAVDVDSSVDQIAGLGFERVASVLQQCAGFHSRWWESPEVLDADWLPRLDGEARRNNLATIVRTGWQPLCELLGDDLTADERSLGARLPEVLDERMCAAGRRPATLIHSDLRGDNLLFTPGGVDVTIVDWQGAGIGPAAWDLAYLFTQSLTVDDRRRHEAHLFDMYVALLAERGIEIGRDELVAGYAEALVFGLVVATSLPVIGDPNEPRLRPLAASMARRSIEAMRDHQVLW